MDSQPVISDEVRIAMIRSEKMVTKGNAGSGKWTEDGFKISAC